MKNLKYFLSLFTLSFIIILSGCNKGDPLSLSDAVNNSGTITSTVISDFQKLKYKSFEDLVKSGKDTISAMNETANLITKDSKVGSVVVGKQGIAIIYKNSRRGALLIDPRRGGSTTQEIPNELNKNFFKTRDHKPSSKKAIFLCPAYWQFKADCDKEYNYFASALIKVGFDSKDITSFGTRDVTLDKYASLSGYGAIIIDAHGMAWPNENNITEVYLMSGEERNNASDIKYNVNDTTNKEVILVTTDYECKGCLSTLYFVNSYFLHRYNDFKKDTTLFYGAFCYSNLGTWKNIVDLCGAGVYIGHSWSVKSNYCAYWLADLFIKLSDMSKSQPINIEQWRQMSDVTKNYWDSDDSRTVNVDYYGYKDYVLWSGSEFRIIKESGNSTPNNIELTLPQVVEFGKEYNISGKWADVATYYDAQYSILAGFVSDETDLEKEFWVAATFKDKFYTLSGFHHYFNDKISIPSTDKTRTLLKFQITMRAYNANDANAPYWLQTRIYKIPIKK